MRRLIRAFCFPCYIFNFFACLTAQGLIKPIQLCRSLDGYLFSILIKLQTTLSLLSYYGYHYNCYCSQTMVWRRYVYQVIQKKSRNSLPDRISLHLLKYLPTVQILLKSVKNRKSNKHRQNTKNTPSLNL